MLTLAGSITGTGSLTKTGGGILELTPTTAQTAITLVNLIVNGGTVKDGGTAGATAALNVSGTVTIGSGAVLQLVSDPRTGAGMGNPPVLDRFNSLEFTSGIAGAPIGTLDIGAHYLLLPRGSLLVSDPGSVLQKAWQNIVLGYNGNAATPQNVGDWTGFGITSAITRPDVALAAGDRYKLAIGIWDSTDPLVQTGQPTNTVLIGLTVLGDAGGDLFAENTDFAIWRNNFGTGDHWSQGDFNYDSFVDNTDFATWRNNVANSTNFNMPTF